MSTHKKHQFFPERCKILKNLTIIYNEWQDAALRLYGRKTEKDANQASCKRDTPGKVFMKKIGLFLVMLVSVLTFTGCWPTESDASVMRRVKRMSEDYRDELGYDVKVLGVVNHKRILDKEEWKVKVRSSKWTFINVKLVRKGSNFWLNIP